MVGSREAALILRCSARRVGQLAAAGDLNGIKTNGGWRFARSEVVGLCEQRNNADEPA